jgi:TRAP transporter TAXI family solute receptor
MRRTVSLLMMTFVLSAAVLTTGTAGAADTTRLSMGAASTGTWIYLFTALLAETWKKSVPGLDITVLATAGTTANYIPMDKGELDLAGASTSGDFYALNGMYFTKTKLSNFTVIMPATKGFNQAFTYADSPINTLKDLDGKRVCVGARGSPTSAIQEEMFKLLGIKPKLVFSTPAEAIEMMKDRRVDAMVYGVGAPWSGVMDVATTQKIVTDIPGAAEDPAAHPYQVADTSPEDVVQTDDPTTPDDQCAPRALRRARLQAGQGRLDAVAGDRESLAAGALGEAGRHPPDGRADPSGRGEVLSRNRRPDPRAPGLQEEVSPAMSCGSDWRTEKAWQEGALRDRMAPGELKEQFRGYSGVSKDETHEEFRTGGGEVVVKRLYTPRDLAGTDPVDDIGFPGQFPFTRGRDPLGYRAFQWPLSFYSGYGSSESANERYRALCAAGSTYVSLAVDLPSQNGYDSDHPLARGEVGKVGVALTTLPDLERVFAGLPLERIHTGTVGNCVGPGRSPCSMASASGSASTRRDARLDSERPHQGIHGPGYVHIFPPLSRWISRATSSRTCGRTCRGGAAVQLLDDAPVAGARPARRSASASRTDRVRRDGARKGAAAVRRCRGSTCT